MREVRTYQGADPPFAPGGVFHPFRRTLATP
jgi:hypothetical protein